MLSSFHLFAGSTKSDSSLENANNNPRGSGDYKRHWCLPFSDQEESEEQQMDEEDVY
jgi:hypothetical protein